MGGGVDGCVEGEPTIGIPIAVDILRTSETTSCFCIITRQIGDAVASCAVVAIDDN